MCLFGGYQNRVVSLKREKHTDDEATTLKNERNVGDRADMHVHEEIYGVKFELAGVKKHMRRINAEVGSLCLEFSRLIDSVERLVKLLAEFQGQCASIVITRLIDSKHMRNPKKVG